MAVVVVARTDLDDFLTVVAGNGVREIGKLRTLTMKFGLFLILMFLCYFSQAQSTTDSVYVEKSLFGYRFYQVDTRLNLNQLPYVMEGNEEARMLMMRSKKGNTWATVLSGTGGFLVGWQLINAAISGGEANWVIAGVGGGLIIASIPVFSASYRQALDAIEMHNQTVGGTSRRIELDVGFTRNGVGLVLGF